MRILLIFVSNSNWKTTFKAFPPTADINKIAYFNYMIHIMFLTANNFINKLEIVHPNIAPEFYITTVS